LNTENLTFSSHLSKAESLNGSVASIHCENQNDDVVNDMILSSPVSQNFLIGLNDINDEGQFVWSDGSSEVFRYWNTGEPNSYGGDEDCVEIYKTTGKWNDVPCSNPNPAIYKLPEKPNGMTCIPVVSCPSPPSSAPSLSQSPSTTPSLSPSSKPSSGSSFFCLNTEVLTFSSHLSKADSLNGSVASIHCENQNDNVVNLSSPVSETIYIGLNDINDEGQFVWSDGSSEDFHYWNTGEPNNVGDEDCVEVYTTTGKWNDISCSIYKPAIYKLPEKPYGMTCIPVVSCP
jgi:hypothetical protein